MNKPAAFRATYSDLKLIKTRQCVQVIFELPLADFDAAYTILGGMPNPASETWFGIAPLIAPESHRPIEGKRSWRDLKPSAQAAMNCDKPVFWAFLNETRDYSIHTKETAAVAVRDICAVASRSLLDTDHSARVLWHQLDSEFQAWERVGA